MVTLSCESVPLRLRALPKESLQYPLLESYIVESSLCCPFFVLVDGLGRMGFSFYTVKVGKQPGIYTSRRQDTRTGTQRYKIMFGREDINRDNVFRDTESVGACQADDFLYVENIEILLARVCASTGVGPPLFYRRETNVPDKGPLVGFAVVLPSNPLGLAITAEGELSTSENDAREDAAFRGIEGVLNATGKKILDYNYRMVMRVQRQLEDLRHHHTYRDRDRMYQLEMENATLKDQVALFNNMVWRFIGPGYHKAMARKGVIGQFKPIKGGKGGTRSTPSKTSENEAVRGALGLDKEGQTDASENVTSSEDRVLQLLGSIRQSMPMKVKGKLAVEVSTGGDLGTKTVCGRKATSVAHKRVSLQSTTKIPPQAISNPGRNVPTMKCMDLLFPPPEGMEFAGLDVVVAAYIFGKDLLVSEVLILDEHCPVTRGSLQTLCPRQQVIDDIRPPSPVNTSYMLLLQIALSPGHHCPQTLEYIRKNFMGLADNLFKGYVPMHKNNHWYLMIIDFVSSELVYLDSLKVGKETKARRDQMRYVAFFLENMLVDRSFYNDKFNCIFLKPYTFIVVEPEIGQQDERSNDCGVWVAQWMIQSHLHNALRTDIGRMAVDNWDARCRPTVRKAMKHVQDLFGKAAATE
ncbi:hypothetical protein Ahy_A09g043360 [Arachis hypogaea]|uniref:Ubiquitin-like protease family profile domain-containing protein n=1 Tax=Arachis hypogaea TaxID=3818 RepID=A0A445BI29_ARAHY|nr:hypothetical protein Ahy_A09g043360 [Arachis hypogaea]